MTFLTRNARQQAVEAAILNFSPDYIEASEILDALLVSLKRRYEDESQDISHEAAQLKQAFEEADMIERDKGPDGCTLAKWALEEKML